MICWQRGTVNQAATEKRNLRASDLKDLGKKRRCRYIVVAGYLHLLAIADT